MHEASADAPAGAHPATPGQPLDDATLAAMDEANPHKPSRYLAHHFVDMHQQHESAKLGLWLFLMTEVLLFGGLFCFYCIYHAWHPEMFIEMNHLLNWKLGAANTVVLITSSLTMALAIRAIQQNKKTQCVVLLGATVFCGFLFLVNKYFEYSAKFHHGLLPGKFFHYHANPAEGLPEIVSTNPHIFLSCYFLMTGLHGFHVLVGMSFLTWILIRTKRGHFSPKYYAPVEMGGIYWHLVDLIWIYLFPLLYLIG